MKIKVGDKVTLKIVNSCYDCPFFSMKYCNLGVGFVMNNWREKTIPEKCPLKKEPITIKLSDATI